ncbi:Translocating chain-associated membrane protein 1 [Geodia barretti]|uniref:Translocating chain-associated membrane protein 1 n=1 Tax=Geodia barretti TaxID=519541 RepID=A0AA35TLL2_GEOBA|nr:Translocating chain-associated membrane protein 1 [Geodia barretti]
MYLFGINQALKCVCFDTKTLNVCLGNKNGRMQWVKMDGNKGQALLRFFAKYYTSIMATKPYASAFIGLDNYVTIHPVKDSGEDVERTMYYHSSQDFFNVGFYCFVWMTIHAAVQKYIWKETVKCLNKHLPPTETSTYYDSGCLAVFYLVFVIWGLGIFLTNGDPTLATTDLYTEHWLEYQSKIFMSPFLKLFMLTQMGFWVHCYVWLTFMEENKTFSNIVLYTLSLVIIAVNYIIRHCHQVNYSFLTGVVLYRGLGCGLL